MCTAICVNFTCIDFHGLVFKFIIWKEFLSNLCWNIFSLFLFWQFSDSEIRENKHTVKQVNLQLSCFLTWKNKHYLLSSPKSKCLRSWTWTIYINYKALHELSFSTRREALPKPSDIWTCDRWWHEYEPEPELEYECNNGRDWWCPAERWCKLAHHRGGGSQQHRPCR